MRFFSIVCFCLSKTHAYRLEDERVGWNIFGFWTGGPDDSMPEDMRPDDPRDCASTGCAGTFAAVYTVGAPGVSSELLRNEQAVDGCFPGLRIWNGEGYGFRDTKDPVSWVARAAGYKHPLTAAASVNPEGFEPQACSPDVSKEPSYDLRLAFWKHSSSNYVASISGVRPGSEEEIHCRLAQYTYFGLLYAHDMARAMGWRLVRASFSTESLGSKDVSYLFQEESSLRCVLAFRGSDSIEDWRSNLWVTTGAFCGLEGVHGGFQAELRRLAGTRMFQELVRPALSKCASVSITGHSLGGAMAELYAGCVNRQQLSEEKRLTLGWSPSAPELMAHHCESTVCDNALEAEAPVMSEDGESIALAPEMMQDVYNAFVEVAVAPVAGFPNGPGSQAWVSPAAEDGWFSGDPGVSCDVACMNVGLTCTREGLHVHNDDAGSSEDVKALISRLGCSTRAGPCSDEFGSHWDVPMFAMGECYHSVRHRPLETFDCAHVPMSYKRRLCYCHRQ